MSSQQKLIDTDDYYYILYREVRSNGELTRSKVTNSEDVDSVRHLLNDILNKTDGRHNLSHLNVESYFQGWISSLLADSRDLALEDEISENTKETIGYLAENFQRSMKTRAKAEGKYVVFIISKGQVIICHSFTGNRAITTDMDVIEELLSVNNIDKYALFEEDETITVTHLDRNDTQSFSDWLGIPEEEIVFDIKGGVRVHTELDGLGCVVEFNEEDISQKLIGSDDYDLRRGMLETPNERNREIGRIQWGNDVYHDTEEFKQDILTINYKLHRVREIYKEEVGQNVDQFLGIPVIDTPQKLIKRYPSGSESTQKLLMNFR